MQVIDYALLLGGCLCAIGFVARLRQNGRWVNPLDGCQIPLRGPSGAAAAATVLAFFALPLVVLSVVAHGLPQEEIARPGSHAWHLAHTADGIAKAALSVLMIVVLGASRDPAGSRPRLSLVRGGVLAVTGVLIILPLVTVQLEGTQLIWRWLRPDSIPPAHPVLLALEESAWGKWGIVQLLAGALVLSPLAEELFFRGVLLQALAGRLKQAWLAIALSGVAFGVVHLGQPQAVLPLTTMGLILGYVRLRGGALWPCVLAHMLFNARTMAFALLAPELLRGT